MMRFFELGVDGCNNSCLFDIPQKTISLALSRICENLSFFVPRQSKNSCLMIQNASHRKSGISIVASGGSFLPGQASMQSCVIDKHRQTSSEPNQNTSTSSVPQHSIARSAHAAVLNPQMPTQERATAALRPIRNVVSASWLYPFKGIWYFCAHSEFYPLFGRRLIPLTITSIVVLLLLFMFAYLPQVALLAIWHGPGAWFNAVFLVLGEGQVVIALLFEALLVDETLVNVFDVSMQHLRSWQLKFVLSMSKTKTDILFSKGYPHSRRPNRPRLTLSNPLSRCAQFCQNARKTYHICFVQPFLLPPNRRIHNLSTAELHTYCWDARISHFDGSESGAVTSLEVV